MIWLVKWLLDASQQSFIALCLSLLQRKLFLESSFRSQTYRSFDYSLDASQQLFLASCLSIVFSFNRNTFWWQFCTIVCYFGILISVATQITESQGVHSNVLGEQLGITRWRTSKDVSDCPLILISVTTQIRRGVHILVLGEELEITRWRTSKNVSDCPLLSHFFSRLAITFLWKTFTWM